jgi:hypothetical protein
MKHFLDFLFTWSLGTLGGIVSICFRFYLQQTLRIQIQGSQGCQKIRKIVRNPKLPIARWTIHPSLSKIKNNLPFFKEFWCIFQWFKILLKYGWMVDLTMSIFEFLIKFLVFWHPWRPWMCIRSDLKPLFETDMSDSSYCAVCSHKVNVQSCLARFNFYMWHLTDRG